MISIIYHQSIIYHLSWIRKKEEKQKECSLWYTKHRIDEGTTRMGYTVNENKSGPMTPTTDESMWYNHIHEIQLQ